MRSIEPFFHLVLASQSPRRKEMIDYLGIPFEIIPSLVEEVSNCISPQEKAMDIAALKGLDILNKTKDRGEFNSVVISSDTIVVLGERFFGKPQNINEAKEFLMFLSGKSHQVVTGVFLGHIEKVEKFFIESEVTFRVYDESLIDHYLSRNEFLDKAGGYGIQGASSTFIESVKGSYSNVVGLPLSDVILKLEEFINVKYEDWKKVFI